MKKIIWRLEFLEEEITQLYLNFESLPVNYTNERLKKIHEKIGEILDEIKE